MESPFRITFPNGSIASGIYAHPSDDLSALLKTLDLKTRRRVLVIVGGASKLSDDDFARVCQLFSDVLVPLAKKWNAYVIDGGTDAGVMRLMGQARTELEASFPLVGVLPAGLAIFPDSPTSSPEAAPLEPNHTHFFLVPGTTWGDESYWIAHLASELADGMPSVTVLINGGDVAWKDVFQNVQEGRVVIVVAGSGRTADVLAAVLRGEAIDQRAQAIVESGLVQAIDLTAGHEELTKTLENVFAATE